MVDFEAILELAKINTIIAQKRSETVDKHKKEVLEVGSKVFVYMDQKEGSRKVYHAWKGPAIIIERKHDMKTFVVKAMSSGKTMVVNQRRLRLWREDVQEKPEKVLDSPNTYANYNLGSSVGEKGIVQNVVEPNQILIQERENDLQDVVGEAVNNPNEDELQNVVDEVVNNQNEGVREEERNFEEEEEGKNSEEEEDDEMREEESEEEEEVPGNRIIDLVKDFRKSTITLTRASIKAGEKRMKASSRQTITSRILGTEIWNRMEEALKAPVENRLARVKNVLSEVNEANIN